MAAKKSAKTAQNDPWGDRPASPGPPDQPGEDDRWRFVAGVSVVSGAPDDGVDPWHTEKQDKRDRTINLEAAMQMTVSMSCGKAITIVTMMPTQPTLPGFALLLVAHASGNLAKSQVARKGASTTLPAANSWMPGPV